MNYIDEIFTRANIQQIREFLLHGTEECYVDKGSFYERLKTAEKNAKKLLRSFYDSDDEYEESVIPIFDYISTVESVYMEIGLTSGILLGMQFIENVNIPLSDEE